MLAVGLKQAKEYSKNPVLIAKCQNNSKNDLYYVPEGILPCQNCETNPLELLTKKEIFALKKKYKVSAKLLKKVEECYANSHMAGALHGHFGSAFGTPLNHFLASCMEWTDCTPRELVDCVAGHSVPTVIATNPPSVAMARAIRGSPNAQAILEVDGIDIGFIGPNDLALSMGVEPGHPDHEAAILKVVEAGKATGKPTGLPIRDIEGVKKRISDSFTFIDCCSDLRIMEAGAKDVLAQLR